MKRIALRITCVAIVGAMSAGTASALCLEPSFYSSAPSSFYQARPSVPYCLNGYAYSQEHTCEQYELDSYFSDVEDYADALKAHHSELAEYANSTVSNANDYLKYVECEVDEVVTQHE